MTVTELRQEAAAAARSDARLAIALLDLALRRRCDDPTLLLDKARIQYTANDLEGTERTLMNLLSEQVDSAAVALLEKVLRRTGRAWQASDWYQRRQGLPEAVS